MNKQACCIAINDDGKQNWGSNRYVQNCTTLQNNNNNNNVLIIIAVERPVRIGRESYKLKNNHLLYTHYLKVLLHECTPHTLSKISFCQGIQ